MRKTTKSPSAASTHSRRGFVRAVAGGSLVAGIDAMTRPLSSAAESSAETPLERVPAFDGTLMSDDATRHTYAQDYGQIVHETPRLVLRPGSVDDVVQMVRFARREGLPIVARGRGHQPFGQAQVRGGVVIDMRSLAAVRAVTADRLEVDAGAEWRTVVRAAIARGRTPAVLTAYLGLTVGGTLSIGGIGIATGHHGAQVDHVLELQVVTGEGAVVDCSAERHPDLFEAVLAGQGQCAIITRAVLRLVPVQPMVREYTLQYPDLQTLLRDEQALMQDDRFDGAVGLIAASPDGWSFALSAIRQFTPPDTQDDAALIAGLRASAASLETRDADYAQYADGIADLESTQSHADLGLLVPGSEALAFIGSMLARLRADDLGEAARMRVFFWKRARFTRALFRIPAQDSLAYLAMLRAETSDPDTRARMLAGNRTLFESNRALGGSLYPYSALALTRDDWRRHYGETWRRLRLAKQRYDPDNVFASGPDLFR